VSQLTQEAPADTVTVRERVNDRWPDTSVFWITSVVLAVITWPISSLAPQVGLDASWHAAMHMAARHHVGFGSGIVFTYGPLGFLGLPVFYYPITAALGMVFTFAVQVSFCASVLAVTRRSVRLRFPFAVLLSFAVVALTHFEPAEVLVVVVAIWALALVSGLVPLDPLVVRWAAALGGIAGGLLLLVKLNAGIVACVVVALAALFSNERRLARFGWVAATAVVVATAGWLLSGNRPSDIPSFVRLSVAITAGYTDAMAIHVTAWQVAVAALLVAAALVIQQISMRHATAHARLGALLITSVLVGSEWKHAFARGDDLHSRIVFAAIAAVLLATPVVTGLRAPALIACLGASVALWSNIAVPGRTAINPVTSSRHLFEQVATFRSGASIRSHLDAGRAAVQDALAIPPEVVDDVRGRTVHVESVESDAAWAYELHWRPVPVFQAYAAYAPSLDAENAAMLRSIDAPQRILRRLPLDSIDGRNPVFDQPQTLLVEACRYVTVVRTERWESAALSPDRCGPEQRLGTVHVDDRVEATVPQPGPEEILTVSISLAPDPLRRIVSTLSKPSRTDRVALDGRDYRLVAANARGLLTLCAPATLQLDPGFVPSSCPRTLSVDHPGGATLQFAIVPVRPTGAS
jgi:hypothetical protein